MPLTESLTFLLDGCDLRRQRRRRWMGHLADRLGVDPAGLSRDDRAAAALQRFFDLHRPHLHPHTPAPTEGSRPGTASAADPLEVVWMSEIVPDSSGMWDSMVPFLQAIVGQGSETQKREWITKVLTMEVVGSYCQTELGHGSNVRGIETTATFVVDDGGPCFVLNTPTLTATKWWPGGLALSATHALVYARLLLPDGDHGVAGFIVTLRDADHRVRPGIQLGELGPKMGEDSHDSGWMRLDHLRVSLDALLAGKGEVSRDGKFIANSTADKRLEHSSMVATRAGWIALSGGVLAKAATIATREARLIDHDAQALRLLRGIASAYVLKLAGQWLLLDAALDRQPEWLIGALKAIACTLSADLIEDLRRCCGGNGYLLNSGIAKISLDNLWRVTAEGDVQVLLSYAGRKMRELAQGSLFHEEDESSIPISIDLRRRAHRTHEIARNRCDSVFDIAAARAYGEWILARWASLRLEKLAPLLGSTETFDVVQKLISVYSHCVVSMPCSGMSLLPEWSPRQGQHEDLLSLVRGLRPIAISTVDAFEYSDQQLLGSTLGRKDGKVYEALLEEARRAPWSRGVPEQ
ncbi:hypothetical protein FOZ62_026140, partial [Perkinsus olseni]